MADGFTQDCNAQYPGPEALHYRPGVARGKEGAGGWVWVRGWVVREWCVLGEGCGERLGLAGKFWVRGTG